MLGPKATASHLDSTIRAVLTVGWLLPVFAQCGLFQCPSACLNVPIPDLCRLIEPRVDLLAPRDEIPKTASILFAAFRSSNVIVVGINIALTRWIRRVAFLGTAARTRPCGHAFFMFRFLARGSAGTYVSFTGRARCGLVLSRRNKRRAE
jgi:hypothetical protein